jgi:Tfp pilus assembly protein PilX
MFKSKKYYINSEKGFALLLALIACVILVALGALVINLSIGDIKTSGSILGNKRAMLAAEKGVNRLIQAFNANPDLTSVVNKFAQYKAEDLAVDPNSNYVISTPLRTAAQSMVGYSPPWGMATYSINVTGSNGAAAYSGKQATIGVGLGYGPIDTSLIYK